MLTNSVVDFYSNLAEDSVWLQFIWPKIDGKEVKHYEVNTINNEKTLECSPSNIKQLLIKSQYIEVIGQNGQAFVVNEKGDYGLTHFVYPLPGQKVNTNLTVKA